MPCEIWSVSVVTLKLCGVHMEIFSFFANLHIYLHMLCLFGCVHMLLCLLLSVRVHMLSITVVSRDGGDSVAMPQRYAIATQPDWLQLAYQQRDTYTSD